jgi:acyl-CoA thioesterase
MISEDLRKEGVRFATWFVTAGTNLKQQISSELGLTPIVVRADDGYTELKFDVDAKYCNYQGRVHGGLIATMLDDTAGASACALVGRGFRGTVSATIEYLASVPPGVLLSEGTIIKQTASLLFAEAKLFSSERALLAKSSCVMAYGPLRK